jgi:hypothetical protein
MQSDRNLGDVRICDDCLKPFSQMLDERPPKTKSVTPDPAGVERRRPGRRLYLMPELLGLPHRDRGTAEHSLPEDDPGDQDPDQLKPFTGVVVAVGVSIPIWMTIVGLIYYLI